MKQLLSLLLSAVLLLSLTACGKASLTDQQKETLLQEANADIDKTQFQGAVCATLYGDEILDTASGKANKDENIGNASDIAYRCASITKQFTAAAIMKLYEQKKLDLQDTIDKYFPDCAHGKEITIHELLCMRSGLVDYINDPDTLDKNGDPQGRKDVEIEFDVSPDKSAKENRAAIEAWIFSQPLRFEPDSNFEYCSSGYLLLGEIVEQVAGESLSDFAQKNFFDPLGMTTAGFLGSYSKENVIVAKAYNRSGDMEWTEYPGAWFGAGDLICSPRDMTKWADALMNGKVVNDASWKLMTTVYSDENPAMPYGYGLMIDVEGGRKIVRHTGHFPSYCSMMLMVPEEGYTCTTVSNHSDENAPFLCGQITQAFKEIKYGK